MLAPGTNVVVASNPLVSHTVAGAVELLHRIQEDAIMDEITATGFQHAALGEFLSNPDDDISLIVFNSDVQGRTDRFVLRFEKP